MMQRFAASLRHRQAGWRVYLGTTAVGAAFLLIAGEIASARTLLGIPGSGVTLIVISAAVLAGPVIGIEVALSLAVLFWAVIADFGAASQPFGVIIGSLIWLLAARLTGTVADVMRTATAERDELREQRQLYELLEAGLLPGKPFSDPGLGVVTRYIPSEQRLHLGGDFLDVRRTSENEIAFIVGDVAGHGPTAAALSATLRAVWQGLILSGAAPELIVRSLNEVVCTEATDDCPFVTAVLGWLDLKRDRLSYLYAGHPPVLLINEEARLLPQTPHLPFGLEPDIAPTFHRVSLGAPCTVFAYTDGLVDARARRESGVPAESWLLERIGASRGCLGERDLDALIAEATGSSQDPTDDIAVLALCVPDRGAPRPSAAAHSSVRGSE